MKLGPVTKLDKRKKTTSKNLTMTSCEIVTSLSIVGFLANLEQSAGRILDTESAEVMFSVTVTFCLTKTGEGGVKVRVKVRMCEHLGVSALTRNSVK